MPDNPTTQPEGGLPDRGIDDQHEHDVGAVLEKVDSSEWEITRRMVDVDAGELLYRLREADVDGSFAETETLTETQVNHSFNVGGDGNGR